MQVQLIIIRKWHQGRVYAPTRHRPSPSLLDYLIKSPKSGLKISKISFPKFSRKFYKSPYLGTAKNLQVTLCQIIITLNIAHKDKIMPFPASNLPIFLKFEAVEDTKLIPVKGKPDPAITLQDSITHPVMINVGLLLQVSSYPKNPEHFSVLTYFLCPGGPTTYTTTVEEPLVDIFNRVTYSLYLENRRLSEMIPKDFVVTLR